MTTTPHEGGPTVQAALNRPMGHLRSSSFIPHAEHVLPEAWEVHDDKLCVIRQMAVLLHKCHGDLLDEFDRLLQREWRDEGLTPNDVKTYCQEHSFPYFCVGQGLLDSWVPAEPKGRSIAFATYDGHAYFYSSTRFVSQWRPSELAPKVGQEVTQKLSHLSSEVVSQLPPVSEWKPWVVISQIRTGGCYENITPGGCYENVTPKGVISQITPGYFHTTSLDAVRKEFLESGRNPKISLRSLAATSSLRYTCVKALDGCSGTCVVRELPEDWEEIGAWGEKIGGGVLRREIAGTGL